MLPLGADAESPGWPACREVPSGGELKRLLSDAEPGSAYCLGDGVHEGPLRIDRRVRLFGGPAAIVRSQGQGSTIVVDAPGTTLEGFTVDGSGTRFDLLDAAIRVGADRVRVEHVHVRDALFGILAEQCRGLVLRENVVTGQPAKTLGMRGDAIRLWEVRGSLVEGNRVSDARDLVVWYSPGNVFLRNQVTGGRYGTHFMYSHDNRVEGSRYVGNVVGVFAMYSQNLELRGNLIAESRGAAGVGIGAKESSSLRIEDNWLLDNTVGVYLDNSPLRPEEANHFRGNALQFGEVGVVFHGPAAGNHFVANRFADQHVPVRVEGRGSAVDAEWRGNDFDDYAGYDFDGDGFGDIPYVLRNLEADLISRVPALSFFRGTVAMVLVEWIGRVAPLFQPTTLLEDAMPAMHVDGPPAVGGGAGEG